MFNGTFATTDINKKEFFRSAGTVLMRVVNCGMNRAEIEVELKDSNGANLVESHTLEPGNTIVLQGSTFRFKALNAGPVFGTFDVVTP